VQLQKHQLQEQTERTDAVTRLVARVNVATYVICKTQPDLKVIDYYYRAIFSPVPTVDSTVHSPPTRDFFKHWNHGTGFFQTGVARWNQYMGGAGVEWAQEVLARVLQHTGVSVFNPEGVWQRFRLREADMDRYLNGPDGYPWIEERIHPHLALEYRTNPRFDPAIQAGSQGPEGIHRMQVDASASYYFENLSSDQDEVRRKAINTRLRWLYRTIKLWLSVHGMVDLSKKLELHSTFTRLADSEDESSTGYSEVYASDGAEFTPDVLFDSQGAVDLYDTSQVMSSD
jgi:hypothetical protein